MPRESHCSLLFQLRRPLPLLGVVTTLPSIQYPYHQHFLPTQRHGHLRSAPLPWQSFPQGMIKLSGNTQPDLQLVNTQTFITYPGLPMKWLWWGLHLLSKVLCLLWGVNCGGMRHHCHIKLNFAAPRPLWLISHSLLPCLFLIFHNLL